ncbi:MAG: hypothetical protein SGI72_01200 [Planctomycetota bacterium]|nr:hypothetical protein [Planctomycetota bacterium]
MTRVDGALNSAFQVTGVPVGAHLPNQLQGSAWSINYGRNGSEEVD